MFKPTLAALAAVFALSPAAFAEGKLVTLTHEYDTALLSSDEGAAQLLAELTRAAKRTCTSRLPASGMSYTDSECVESLFVAAVKQIHAATTEKGAAVAPAFEKVALTQLASAD